jgi:hypothetical protein
LQTLLRNFLILLGIFFYYMKFFQNQRCYRIKIRPLKEKPGSKFPMILFVAPTGVPITGKPEAISSRVSRPKPSSSLVGKTKISAIRNILTYNSMNKNLQRT